MSYKPETSVNEKSVNDFESVVVIGGGESLQQVLEALVYIAGGRETVEPQHVAHL